MFWKILRVITETTVNFCVKRKNDLKFRLGHQWVSITNEFCRYLLSQEKRIRKRFKYTSCSDEIFIQTLLYSSPFQSHIYDESNNNNGSKREIDWKRGNPYVWGQAEEDFLILKNSEQMFARKFDEQLSANLIPQIVKLVKENK